MYMKFFSENKKCFTESEYVDFRNITEIQKHVW